MSIHLHRVAAWNKTAGKRQLKTPGTPEEADFKLRLKLLREEIDELEAAYEAHDTVEILDALCDIQVVLDGGIAEAGMMKIFGEAMQAVCDSNDSKFEDGKPVLREDGKILKGRDYVPVDLAKLLEVTKDEYALARLGALLELCFSATGLAYDEFVTISEIKHHHYKEDGTREVQDFADGINELQRILVVMAMRSGNTLSILNYVRRIDEVVPKRAGDAKFPEGLK